MNRLSSLEVFGGRSNKRVLTPADVLTFHAVVFFLRSFVAPTLRNPHVGCFSRTRARTMDVDEVVDDLFSGRGGTGSLPQSIPLPQMICLLVDLWEAEGLFD